MKETKKLIGRACICLAPYASAVEVVKVCDLGGGVTKRVEVVRVPATANTHTYYVRQHGALWPFFDEPESSRGESVRTECAGRKRHALVVSGEFTANALQGFVLTYNSADNKTDRLDFAERSPPEWLYLGAQEVIVVIPTFGHGETNKKYVAYRRRLSDSHEVEVEGMDELPAAARFEAIKLSGLRNAAVERATAQVIYEGYPDYHQAIGHTIFKMAHESPFPGIRKGAITWKGRRLHLRHAKAFPGEITQNDSLGDYSVSYEASSFACVEGQSSAASGTSVRRQSVYLIDMHKPKAPKLYKLPSLFASCLGIRIDSQRRALFDAATYIYADGGADPMGVLLREHKISGGGFLPTGRTVIARFVEPDNVWKFTVEAVN